MIQKEPKIQNLQKQPNFKFSIHHRRQFMKNYDTKSVLRKLNIT